jgi:hypothetical protein
MGCVSGTNVSQQKLQRVGFILLFTSAGKNLHPD